MRGHGWRAFVAAGFAGSLWLLLSLLIATLPVSLPWPVSLLLLPAVVAVALYLARRAVPADDDDRSGDPE